jgi:Tol biopolymer transport system component
MDRAAGTTRTINTAASVPSLHTRLRFSLGGRFLAYTAAPSNTNQVYLYDFLTQSNLRVSSAAASGSPGDAASDSPDISADGRFVAYRSSATNLLVPPTSNSVPNLFLYDRLAGTSTLLTASRYSGGPADNRSMLPVFSSDGRTLIFQSWASDLMPQDFNHWGDVFALNFLYLSISPAGALTWPSRPGESYQVQYKDTLTDAEWQVLNGTITITGNQAQMINSAPVSAQKYYRVVAYPN